MLEAQQAVAQFVQRHGLETDVEHRLLDMVAEVGELAKEVLKGTNYGREPMALTADWCEELGDVLFALICLANASQVDLADALRAALDKYEARLIARGDAGSAGSGSYGPRVDRT
jgi:NTP pyrophosphatase (non-canonical NTP hydrolase)